MLTMLQWWVEECNNGVNDDICITSDNNGKGENYYIYDKTDDAEIFVHFDNGGNGDRKNWRGNLGMLFQKNS